MNSGESNLELKIGVNDISSKLSVVFFNASKMTLWFPIEPKPAYRVSEKSHLLEIWLGYFEEVHGLHKGQYMLPAMQPVRPGGEFKLELTLTPEAKKALKAGAKAKIRARIATKYFVDSRIRNSQPFEDYLSNSIVVGSASPGAISR